MCQRVWPRSTYNIYVGIVSFNGDDLFVIDEQTFIGSIITSQWSVDKNRH